MPSASTQATAEAKEDNKLTFFDSSLHSEHWAVEQDTPLFPPCLRDHEPCILVYIDREQYLLDEVQSDYATVMSAHDAAQKAACLRESIFKHHTCLRKCMVGKHDGVLKKWRGWKQSRRISTISNACPDLASKQFIPDVLLGKIRRNASDYRSQFLLFPMTIETLSETYQTLLGFAHCRSSTRPEDCVGFDWEQLRRGLDLNAFAKVFGGGCIKMFGANFGRFKPFDEVEVHCYKAFPTPAALLILERQDMIYQMLCKIILPIADSITETKGSAEWDALATRHFRRREDVETLFQHIDGIFSSPIPDVAEILVNVRGRKEYYEDELASLSSDVEHFLGRLAEYQAMRDGDPRPKSEQSSLATVTSVAFGAFENTLCWHFLSEVLEDLVNVMKTHKDDLEWGQPRSVEYQEALWKLSSFAEHRLFCAVDDLRSYCTSSTEFTKHPKRAKRQLHSASNELDNPQEVDDWRNEEELYKADRLLSLLTQLCHESRNIPLVLPELNKLLLKREEANRLNFRMMQAISEIGDLWRLIELCRYQRPANPEPQQGFLEEEESLAARYFTALSEGTVSEEMRQEGRLEKILGGLKVAKPWGERNRAWLDAVDKYQRRLQRGMDKARRLFLGMLFAGGLRSGRDIIFVQNLIEPEAAKLYVPVSEEERERILSPAIKHKPTTEPYVPPPQETEETFKKTRAFLAEDAIEETRNPLAAAPSDPPVELPPVEVFELPTRSYRMLNHLFAGGGHPEGQVTFQDFGRFMAALGFGQIALGGSEYRFSKAGDGGRKDQSIVVHKRHPDPAYRANDLRRIGRRLSSRFGWTLENFRLA